MKNKRFYWCLFFVLIFLCVPMPALAANDAIGVAYRGHVQDLGDVPADGTWVDSPEIIGTVGQSKRIEGFEIKLTGEIPSGLELCYNVHVQNKGWLYDVNDATTWPKDGEYAGTRGDSLRIEAVKIILTDADGQPVSDYSVLYRGHVQNVGDLPEDETQWIKDGEQLGTVGSSLRLEALVVKVEKNETNLSAYVALLAQIDELNEGDFTTPSWATLQTALEDHPMTVDNSQLEVDDAVMSIQTAVEGLVKKADPVVYETAGTYGPETEILSIDGDVKICADGVILQNLLIHGDLTISEAVGDGDVTLNNVTVEGDTVFRGCGINSIHINGGSYKSILVEKTPTGQVRIVALDVNGLEVVISEDATGQVVILEGQFESVTANAPNMKLTTQGKDTSIGNLTVGTEGEGSTVTLNSGTTVDDLVLDGTAAVKGQGTVHRAEVNADGVVFASKPDSYTVDPEVVIPPEFPPTGGGGGVVTPVSVTGVSLNKTVATVNKDGAETLTATVAPANAANKAVSWSSDNESIATVDTDGKVTGVAEGTAIIMVTTADGNKTATCTVTVKDLNPAITGVTRPVYGAIAEAAIDETAQYSGTIQWRLKDGDSLAAGGAFAASTTYVATITLTLKDPYTTADISADFFTVAGAIVSNAVNSLEVIAEFPPTGVFQIDENGMITAYSGAGGNETIPDTVNGITVTGIGVRAFYGNTTLTGITIPASVTTIGGNGAFANCGELTTVTFAEGSVLETIGEYTFYSCSKLGTITIPASVTSIGVSAFSGCLKLETITIPESVTSIGNSAFANCKELTTVTFAGDSVLESFGADSFFRCTKLTGIIIPAKVTTIGNRAFAGCWKLATVTFAGESTLETIGEDSFISCNSLTGITIPASVKTIGNGAFNSSAVLTTVTFAGESTLETIGEDAFNFSEALTGIIIPASVTSIGNDAFYHCGELTSVTFAGDSVLETIGEGAFYDCLKLGTVTIPASVKTIGNRAFKTCTGLTTVTFAGDSALETIGEDAFYECTVLTGITIPKNVTTIGSDAFYGCEGLSTVIFAENAVLTTIDQYTFNGCTALKAITIPASVTLIDNYAFRFCTGMTLTFKGDAPTVGTSEAIPADTIIQYYSGKTGFTVADWPGYILIEI
jgi:uncharacterized protein YjdB